MRLLEFAPDAKVGEDGQASIPKEVLEHFHMKPGDQMRFFVHPRGHIAVLPVLPIHAVHGMLQTNRATPVTIEEMDEGIAAGAVSRYLRFKTQ